MTISDANEPERVWAQVAVVSTARSILFESLSLVEGVRRLVDLAHALGMDRDPDLNFLIAVDSETDHLPVGEVRGRWAVDALQRADEELRAYEDFYRADTLRICEALIRRYDKAQD